MSKFGVGIGEEFPLDEETRPPPGAEETCCGSSKEWQNRRALRREAWRRLRDQIHAEWHARARAMAEQYRQRDPVEPMDGSAERSTHVHHLVIGALALVGLAALFGSRRRY